jgi:hypothetical protein
MDDLGGMEDSFGRSIRRKPFGEKPKTPHSGRLHHDAHAKLNYSKTAR